MKRLFFCRSISCSLLWAEDFYLTEFFPDYFSPLPSRIEEEGLYLYNFFDYTQLIEDENYYFHDYQFSSGLLYKNEFFTLNGNWSGSQLLGSYTIEGLDEVFEDGDRELKTDAFLHGLQFDFLSAYLDFSYYFMSDQSFYSIRAETPPLFGLYAGFVFQNTPITLFYGDLIKSYNLPGIILSKSDSIYMGWRNDFLDLRVAYDAQAYWMTGSESLENPVIIDMDWISDFGFTASADLDLSFLSFTAHFSQMESTLYSRGRTEDSLFLFMENEDSDEDLISIFQREMSARIDLFQSKLQLGGFYQYLLIPLKGNNQGFVDMAPLSPVGLLYRRRDYITNFGLFIQQGGGFIGTSWEFPYFNLGAEIKTSYASAHVTGDYYYIDGMMSLFPFPRWTDQTIHNEFEFNKTISYVLLDPKFSASLKMGPLTLSGSIKQLIPIRQPDIDHRDIDPDPEPDPEPEPEPEPDPGSIFDDIRDWLDRFSESTRRGGFRAEILVIYKF